MSNSEKNKKMTEERLEKMLNDIYKTKPEITGADSSSEMNLIKMMEDNDGTVTASGAERMNSKRKINIYSIIAACAALALAITGAYFGFLRNSSDNNADPPALSSTATALATTKITSTTENTAITQSTSAQEAAVTSEAIEPPKAEKKFLLTKTISTMSSLEPTYLIYEYDENGNLLKETEYKTADNSVLNIRSYKYDSRGSTIEERYQSYNVGPYDRIEKFSYEYNTDGTIRKYTDYNKESQKGEYYVIYTYDGAGNTIAADEYSMDGTFRHKNEMAYDSENRIISKKENTLAGDIVTILYSYDNMGNLIKAQRTYNEVDVEGTDIRLYEYDSNGNCIKEVAQREGDPFPNCTINREFDSNGNCTKEQYDFNDRSSYIMLYKYDEYGNKINETEYDLDMNAKNITDYEYTEMK